jgi:hypothetical protein
MFHHTRLHSVLPPSMLHIPDEVQIKMDVTSHENAINLSVS